jgi:hypothetical protein
LLTAPTPADYISLVEAHQTTVDVWTVQYAWMDCSLAWSIAHLASCTQLWMIGKPDRPAQTLGVKNVIGTVKAYASM